jgi:hypothetical protein
MITITTTEEDSADRLLLFRWALRHINPADLTREDILGVIDLLRDALRLNHAAPDLGQQLVRGELGQRSMDLDDTLSDIAACEVARGEESLDGRSA